MHLHMVEFNGITFGMDVQDKAAFRAMKKNAFFREITPRGLHYPKKVACVWAQDIAAVMSEAGWLVSETRCMQTVRWGESAEHYIVYEEPAIPKNVKTSAALAKAAEAYKEDLK